MNSSRMSSLLDSDAVWPALPLQEWRDSYRALHMWSQVVGKVALALAPPVNHWWQVALRVTPRGLVSATLPYGERTITLSFDFVDHALWVVTSDGVRRRRPLESGSVAAFYHDMMEILEQEGLPVTIWSTPVEIPDPIPFEQDTALLQYDRDAVERFFQIIRTVDLVFRRFRSGFIGKCSPVQFFWGSFDLAVTRFSGRRAPVQPDADLITREAYSHEVISAGFWPGTEGVVGPAFYSYAAPAPSGYEQSAVSPAGSYFDPTLKEYLLPYESVRREGARSAALLEFLQSSYAAAARLGNWEEEETRAIG